MGNSDSKSKQMYEYYFDPLTGEFRDAAIDKIFDNNNFINQFHSHIKEKTENRYAGVIGHLTKQNFDDQALSEKGLFFLLSQNDQKLTST